MSCVVLIHLDSRPLQPQHWVHICLRKSGRACLASGLILVSCSTVQLLTFSLQRYSLPTFMEEEPGKYRDTSHCCCTSDTYACTCPYSNAGR
jgi:hypothetical protein